MLSLSRCPHRQRVPGITRLESDRNGFKHAVRGEMSSTWLAGTGCMFRKWEINGWFSTRLNAVAVIKFESRAHCRQSVSFGQAPEYTLVKPVLDHSKRMGSRGCRLCMHTLTHTRVRVEHSGRQITRKASVTRRPGPSEKIPLRQNHTSAVRAVV